MMSGKYRVCLVGCGRMGVTIDDEVRNRPNSSLYLPYSHAAGYAAVEETDLVAVADIIPEKVKEAQRRYNVPRGYTDWKEMILKEKPDILSIATRPGNHAEITIFAAEYGVKGIYCEKPLCCSMEEADAMLEACRRANVKFNYGTQRRYTPLYMKMRELIETGEIGDVQCVIAHCGIGAAQWGHTHTADMIMFLAGDPEVDYVQGTVSVDERDFDDNRIESDPGIMLGFVRFKNGVLGYMVAGTGYEFEVSGSKGKLRSLNNGLSCQMRRSNEWGELEEVPFPQFPRESGTVGCIKDLIDAFENDRLPSGDIELACRSQEMIFGFVESHRLGGKRVKMPLENRSLRICRPDW